jgi:hypothetical protein
VRRVFLARSLCVSTNFSRYFDFPAAHLSLGQRKRAAVVLAMVGPTAGILNNAALLEESGLV